MSAFSSSSSSTLVNFGFPEEDLRTKGHDNPGYFPARLGQLLGRYCVVRKLGWGCFSNVWLAKDRKEDRFVALKIATCDSTKSHEEQRSDELSMLQKIASSGPGHHGSKHVVSLYDSFRLTGPHGDHLCLVTEVLGPSMGDLRAVSERGSFSMDIVKRVTKHILIGLEYLHNACGIIHTDLKHDNILIRLKDLSDVVSRELVSDPSTVYAESPEKGSPISLVRSQPLRLSTGDILSNAHLEAVIIDVGYAHWKGSPFRQVVQPNAFRAPEVILGGDWDTSVDIWNLGCLVAEWLFGHCLFEYYGVDSWDEEEDHLARMTEALEMKFDPVMLSKCRRKDEFFNPDGSFKNFTVHSEPTWSLQKSLSKLDVQKEDLDAAECFLRRCLQLNPETRASARKLLDDPWLIDV